MKHVRISTAHSRPLMPASRRRNHPVKISEPAIRRAARERGPQEGIASICFNYAVTAAKLRWRKIIFRQNRNARACEAYCQMRTSEFQALNARQAWANWRTIPRNLSGRLPRRPVFALDLCCGIGDSTEVLAYYCAPGSSLLGLEFNPAFVARARQRVYRHRDGRQAQVRFAVQNVLETFRDGTGNRLANESVDLVNASGAMGCHFDCDAAAVVARECARVIKHKGLALIDAGREGAAARQLIDLFGQHGFRPIHQARSCVFDRYWQLCLRRDR